MKRVLVVAPHPDDETLGCGGTLLAHKEVQDSVFWCTMTKPYEPEWPASFLKKRAEEVKQVSKHYGFKKVFELGFPTVKLDLVGHKALNDALSKVVAEVDPHIVYLPNPNDLNKDHEMTFHAGIVAIRHAPSVQQVLTYETVSETEYGAYSHSRLFFPNYFVPLTKEQLDKKIKIMATYESELKKAPHPRSEETIRALATKRGSEAQSAYAESFSVVKIIVR